MKTNDSDAGWRARAQLVELRALSDLGDADVPCPMVDDISVSRELSAIDALGLLYDARHDPAMKDLNVLVTTTLPDALALGEICNALARVTTSERVLSIADVFADTEQATAIEADLARRMTDPKTLEVMRRFGVRAPRSILPDELNDEPLEELLAALTPRPVRWPPTEVAARDDGGPYRLLPPYVAHGHRDVTSIHWDVLRNTPGEAAEAELDRSKPMACSLTTTTRRSSRQAHGCFPARSSALRGNAPALESS